MRLGDALDRHVDVVQHSCYYNLINKYTHFFKIIVKKFTDGPQKNISRFATDQDGLSVYRHSRDIISMVKLLGLSKQSNSKGLSGARILPNR